MLIVLPNSKFLFGIAFMMLFIYETLGCNIYGKCVEKKQKEPYIIRFIYHLLFKSNGSTAF